jgi:hypothetical protein
MNEITAPLSADEARALTDEVRRDAEALWAKLLRLYDGGAHTALGYGSWREYARAEFGFSKTNAYRLLEAGRVVEALPEGPRPTATAVTDALAAAGGPEAQRAVWAEAVERHGERPSATQVRAIVAERAGQSRPRDSAPTPTAELHLLSDEALVAEANALLDDIAVMHEEIVRLYLRVPPEHRDAFIDKVGADPDEVRWWVYCVERGLPKRALVEDPPWWDAPADDELVRS